MPARSRTLLGLWVGRQWLAVRCGRSYVSLRGPRHQPVYTERYRIGCRVLPLRGGWRLVLRG